METKRAYSLDALRGYAILTMVLSATVVFGILPGWMYHAQTPPPDHVFNPSVYGITWVDLVFPFFLFAMGAAFPFSVRKKYFQGISKFRLSVDALVRGLQLTFFAIYIQHLYPWVLSAPQDARAWCIALGGFVLMFPMFMRIPLKMPEWGHRMVKWSAFAAGFVLVMTVSYAGGRVFSPGFSNVIILVLANMAVFGTLIYIFTIDKPLWRIAVLPLIMAVLLGSTAENSWVKALYDFTPVPWMYEFRFLKYLFIVIPGSIAGEYLLESMGDEGNGKVKKSLPVYLLLLTLGLILCNLCCLYSRWLVVNLFMTIVMIGVGEFLLKKADAGYSLLWKKLFRGGAYLLVLGLFFEAFEGGIRKDHSTYSYYLVTSGLAFMALLFFHVVCDYYKCRKPLNFLIMAGQNPMLAYVAPNLVVMPLLNLIGVASLLTFLTKNVWLGFVHGLVLTGLSTGVVMFFSRIKWFWRT